MRDRQSTPDTKSHHSQPTKERETQRTTAQEEALVTQQDPLTQTISRIGSPPSAKVHANLLSRATADHLARGRQLMLQMQRQYGNRYVQRVVELSRQGAGETEATPEVEATIEQARGGGRSLDAGIQRQMESAFGTNFSGVRVHTDSTADALNQSLSARAFTTGQDIFFRQGEYNPGSSSGKELLAHELTHVVQQTGTVRGKLAIREAGDRYEQEADKVASEVLQRLDAPAAVQRQEAIEEEIQTKLDVDQRPRFLGLTSGNSQLIQCLIEENTQHWNQGEQAGPDIHAHQAAYHIPNIGTDLNNQAINQELADNTKMVVSYPRQGAPYLSHIVIVVFWRQGAIPVQNRIRYHTAYYRRGHALQGDPNTYYWQRNVMVNV